MPERKRVRYLALPLLIVVAGCQARLTPDGPAYKVLTSGPSLTVVNISSGGNNREVYWSPFAVDEPDSTECATWVNGGTFTQNGLAFRIESHAGGWDAVVLERNIWMGEFWSFVVVYFHGAASDGQAFDVGPSVDLGDYLGRAIGKEPYPLRVCAALKGTTLTFAVAKPEDVMPAPGTPGRGAVVTIDPKRAPSSGYTGTYVGHLPPQGTATVSDVVVDSRPVKATA